MKANLEFDVESSDDMLKLQQALKAPKLAAFIHEFDNKLRSFYKYDDLSVIAGDEALGKIRQSFFDTLEEFDIDLENDL